MQRTWTGLVAAGVLALAVGPAVAAGADAPPRGSPAQADELKVKREEVFEFVRKPAVTREGDRVTVAFESKGLCDATVVIENQEGRIVRHLASGVLGPRAPEPLQKDSKKQTLVWDGKDDRGTYLDDKGALRVRVSLGLQASFEKNLYWSPHKRISSLPIMAAAPEGVYVYDGFGVDHLRLFGHDGKYLRTVHPFPADKVKEVQGLPWKDFPEGYRLPTKFGFYQQTMLNSGTNESIEDKNCRYGWAAVGMAAGGRRLALTYQHLNRLATDGSSGGLPLQGPKVGVTIFHEGYGGADRGEKAVGPSSLAFSPDQQTLYLTGYLWFSRFGSGAIPAVMKLDYAKDAPPAVFVGNPAKEGGWGDGDGQLNTPMSVAVDAAGRVYVADYMNDRVQVFAPEGKLLKSIKTEKPAKVLVHQKSGEIYVLTWTPNSVPHDVQRKFNFDPNKKQPTALRVFSPMPEPRMLSSEPINLGWGDPGYFFAIGQLYQVELDSWSDPPTLWTVGRKHLVTDADERINGGWAADRNREELWKHNIELQQRQDGKWRTVFSFAEAALKAARRMSSNKHKIQYLWFNPKNERLYVGEPDSGPTVKACNELLKINPDTGAIEPVRLPFNALDLAFDLEGCAYLRTTDLVLRYDAETWREVPWDYGSEFKQIGDEGGASGHTTSAVSALVMPAGSPVCYHQGGMEVSALGHLAVACHNRISVPESDRLNKFVPAGKATRYELRMYPGRYISSISTSVHVWDKHGKLVQDDAVPGLPQLDGVGIDAQGDLYVLAAPSRILGGAKYFNDMSETLMKFRPGKGRLVCTGAGPIPLPKESQPDRAADIYGGGTGVAWAQGAEWFFGGVGFAGFNSARGGGGCACWHGRFRLDYLGRCFVPAPYQYNVAVLDKNGNLILRVGQYGNADSAGPGSPAPVGGDGIGLFNACYVATHTDHRLFIADSGNARIVCAKLGYHATETVNLKEVEDRGRK